MQYQSIFTTYALNSVTCIMGHGVLTPEKLRFNYLLVTYRKERFKQTLSKMDVDLFSRQEKSRSRSYEAHMLNF